MCQILQAKQEKRKRVQAELSALRPLKTRLRAAHEAHEKESKKCKALVEEEESVMALLLANQRLTQQAKGGENCKRRKCTEYAEFFNQVIFTNESSAVGGWATECAGQGSEGELQPVARAIRCPGASVPASTTASPNPGGDAVAPLAFSFTAKRDNSACGRGGAQCGDDIDWECGGKRQWATFSARVEIPPYYDRSEAWKC